MKTLLWFYVDLCLLKKAPQDAPYSQFIFYISIFSYFMVGVVLTSFTQAVGVAIALSLIQTLLVAFVTNLLLWIRKTPERFKQTISALTMSGAMIGVVALPILMLFSNTGDESSFLFSTIWLLLIVWETVIVGHIVRHAMEIPFLAGLGAALIYMYLSFAVTLRLSKIIAAPLSQ